MFGIIISITTGIAVITYSTSHEKLILLLAIMIFVFSTLIISIRYYYYGFNDPYLVFTLFFFLYNFSFLFEASLKLSKGLLPSETFPVTFSVETYVQAALASFLASVGLFVGAVFVLLFRRKNIETNMDRVFNQHLSNAWIGTIGILFFMFGLMLMFLNYQRIGGFFYALTLSRVERLSLFNELRGNLPYSPFVFAGLALVWFDYAKNRRSRVVAFGLLILWILLMIVQGDRRYMTYSLLIAFATFVSVRYPRFKIKPNFIVAMIVLYVTFAIFAQIRGLIQPVISGQMSLEQAALWIEQNASLSWMLPGSNEFAGPYFTLLYSIEYSFPQESYLYGSSYLQAIPSVLPRSLYPGVKPQALSNAFAAHVHLKHIPWSETTPGWGYSPVTEAYNNFSIWGVPLIFFVIGLFCEWVARIKYKRNLFGVLFYAILFPQMLNLNRIDIAWVLQEMFYFVIALIIGIIIILFLSETCRGSKFNTEKKERVFLPKT